MLYNKLLLLSRLFLSIVIFSSVIISYKTRAETIASTVNCRRLVNYICLLAESVHRLYLIFAKFNVGVYR